MQQNLPEEGWQQLENRIEDLVGRLMKTDVQRIEYKPQFAVPLLEIPSAYQTDNQRERE